MIRDVAPAPDDTGLYTSRGFLEVIAAVYFPGRCCHIRDHAVAGLVFRLLTVDSQGPVLRQTFLDMHEPLPGVAPRAGQPSVALLPGVAQGLVGVRTFRQRSVADGWLGAPTTRWEDFPTWDTYLAMLRQRHVLAEDQRRLRRLEETVGPVDFLVEDPADDVLPTAFAWKSARDREMARPDLFANDANRRFFQEMRARGLLRASTIRADGQLLAVWLGAIHRRRWSGWVFAFDAEPSLAKYSLGRQLLYPMLQASHAAGHDEFDFSIGTEAYKLHFATHVRPIGPLGTPPAAQRAAAAVRQLLVGHTWWHERARAVRRWVGARSE